MPISTLCFFSSSNEKQWKTGMLTAMLTVCWVYVDCMLSVMLSVMLTVRNGFSMASARIVWPGRGSESPGLRSVAGAGISRPQCLDSVKASHFLFQLRWFQWMLYCFASAWAVFDTGLIKSVAMATHASIWLSQKLIFCVDYLNVGALSMNIARLYFRGGRFRHSPNQVRSVGAAPFQFITSKALFPGELPNVTTI